MITAYTVVLIPDDSRVRPARLDVTKIRVEHVAAETVGQATALALEQAAAHGDGPEEPIDWAVLFMAVGFHRDVSGDRSEPPPFTSDEARAMFELIMFGPKNLTSGMAVVILDKLRPRIDAGDIPTTSERTAT